APAQAYRSEGRNRPLRRSARRTRKVSIKKFFSSDQEDKPDANNGHVEQFAHDGAEAAVLLLRRLRQQTAERQADDQDKDEFKSVERLHHRHVAPVGGLEDHESRDASQYLIGKDQQAGFAGGGFV